MPEKHVVRPKTENSNAKSDAHRDVEKLRSLAHDLSNSIEAIMQASYLLSQAKLDAGSKRWVQLLQTSSDEAAQINREIRKLLRAMSEQ
ncbi:MAG TPA: hypothetical protein VH596_17890 [Terriglobales bacterium]|jgi:K+-sensing histidine kinase KdpD